MRGMAAVLLALPLLLAAGCTAPGEPSGEPPDGAPPAPGAVADPPPWQLGDHWDYTSTDGEPFSLVVADETASDWILATNAAGIAYFDARFDASYLGPVRKSDLAGSQGSDRVQFFRFPLADGDAWTTPWDDLDLRVTVSETAPGRYRLEGHAGERLHVAYEYSHDTRFFDKAEWYDANGTVSWGFQLDSSGRGFTGTLHRYAFGTLHAFVATAHDSRIEEPEIPAERNEVGVRAVLLCNSDPGGLVVVGVNSAAAAEDSPAPMLPQLNEPEEGRTLDCSAEQAVDAAWVMENPGGRWEIGLLVAAPNGVAHLFLEERTHERLDYP